MYRRLRLEEGDVLTFFRGIYFFVESVAAIGRVLAGLPGEVEAREVPNRKALRRARTACVSGGEDQPAAQAALVQPLGGARGLLQREGAGDSEGQPSRLGQ